MRTKKNANVSILLFISIILVINVLSDRYFLRLDFTGDDRYTLSKTTEDILESLQEPVTVKAYFSEELPAEVAKVRRDFKEMLIEYANLSNGMLKYEFINPDKNEKIEQEAYGDGVQPVLVNMREKNEVKQQKVYLGAVIKMGERSEVIPFLRPGSAMQYALSSNIKKLSVIDKPTVGFVQGHGEPSLEAFRQVNGSLSIMYNVQPVNLNESQVLDPMQYKTLAIVAPSDSFSLMEISKLDQYLAAGGRLFLALNRVQDHLQESRADVLNTGLESWLASKNIQLGSDLVLDVNCGSITVQRQQGYFTFNTPIPFYYLPIINRFPEHPITEGLESVMLQFASTVGYKGDTSQIKMTPILTTSDKSAVESVPLMFNIEKQWQESDFPLKKVVTGAIFEGNFGENGPGKIVLIGDGDFAVTGEGRNAMQRQEDNINLMVNSIDWLSDDTGLIELRTKAVSTRPLDQLEDSTKTLLKYLNFGLPLLLIIIYGIIRMQVRRNQRIKRMEGNYV